MKSAFGVAEREREERKSGFAHALNLFEFDLDADSGREVHLGDAAGNVVVTDDFQPSGVDGVVPTSELSTLVTRERFVLRYAMVLRWVRMRAA